MSKGLITHALDHDHRCTIGHDDVILVIVDVQEAFLKKLSLEQAEDLLENIRFLSEVAIRLEIPVFVTVEEASSNGPLHPSLKAVIGPDAPERDKEWFGLCGQDNLRGALLDQDRRTAVLVGLETDVCVLQSAVGLKQLGFCTLMVLDAVAAPQPDHGYGLDRARMLGVELIHTKGLYYELARSLTGLEHLKKAPAIRPPTQSQL